MVHNLFGFGVRTPLHLANVGTPAKGQSGEATRASLQAYVDGSGTGDARALIIAGYIAAPDTWAALANEWRAHLEDLRMSCFKMSATTLRPEIGASFYRIIEKHNVLSGISITVDTAALRKVVHEVVPPEEIKAQKLENPYFFAVRGLVLGLAALHHEIGISASVDFVFDEDTEKDGFLSVWPFVVKDATEEIRRMLGATPVFGRDHLLMPLQAADLLAYWIRHWHLAGRQETKMSSPFPWQPKKRMNYLHMLIGEKEARTSFEHAKRVMPFAEVRARRGTNLSLPDPSSPLQWAH
ncbi:DUF3800 domain-containing protein [Bradyrhizobium sp. OAE829]|uniref:DUF3800 domain-containing protein n=1 Tax=Bradyrhizobium sp. OAE829 TaxID=2663807 RepID=UPI0033912011